MSYPSLVCMTQVPQSCSLDDILTAMRHHGHHPIRGSVSTVRNICLIQFADSDAAAEAISQLNGKPISFSAYGFCAKTTFHLIQCPENNFKLHVAWVGNLAPQVDGNKLFKFFGDRFNNLFDAKVMIDSDGKSRGFGYLAFSTEEDLIFCIKTMDGSSEFGDRVIRVKPVATGSSGNCCPMDISLETVGIDSYDNYMSWNEFIEPAEFIAVKANLAAYQNEKGGKDDEVETISEHLNLVEYTVTSNTDYMDKEMLERDYHLWDALECSKWLPPMALNSSINEPFPSRESSKTEEKKADDPANKLPNGTNVDESKVVNVFDESTARPKQMPATKVPQCSLRTSEDVAKKPLEIIHLHVIGPLAMVPQTDTQRYIVVFVDEYSRLGAEYIMQNMTELGQKFESFLRNSRKRLGRHAKVRHLHVCDMNNFIGDCMRGVCSREAISLQQTPSDIPPLATKFATYLLRKVRSLMLDSGLPKRLWTLAVAMAVYIYNRTPLDSLDYEVPYEKFSHKVPEEPYYFTRFGCVAYVKLPLNEPTNGRVKVPRRSIPNGTSWADETETNSNDVDVGEKNEKLVRYFFVGYQYSAYLLFHPESNTFTAADQIWCNEKRVYGDVFSQMSAERNDTDWSKSLSVEKESIRSKPDDFGPPSKRTKIENHVHLLL